MINEKLRILSAIFEIFILYITVVCYCNKPPKSRIILPYISPTILSNAGKKVPGKGKFIITQFTNKVRFRYMLYTVICYLKKYISYIKCICFTSIIIHYKLQKLHTTNLITLNFLVTVYFTLKNNF